MTLRIAMCTGALLVASCATSSKSELDAEVRRLCAIDGGVKVHEATALPPKMVDQYGRIRIPLKSDANVQDQYYYESTDTYYRRGNPEMWRSEYRIIRAHDGKILGTSVRYTRRGGDAPGPWHDSSFSCPPISRDEPSLESSVFSKGTAR